MLLLRSALIEFYDHPKSWVADAEGRGSHVSALTGVIGEDLVLGALVHYWKGTGHEAAIISYQCNTGSVKGKRLDAWILLDHNAIFQVEVKNWSGHSLNGYNLSTSASVDEIARFAGKRWERFFGKDTLPEEIAKALVPMKVPDAYASLQRKKLICFWSHVVNATGQPYGTHQMHDGDELDVFLPQRIFEACRMNPLI